MEKFYFIENWAYFPLFVDVEAGITLSDGSSNGNIIESDSERLSDHSGDDSNESVESVIKDSTKVETECYCDEVLGFGLKKELIEQIVASLPPTTRLEYLQFFNEVAIVVLPSIKIVLMSLSGILEG